MLLKYNKLLLFMMLFCVQVSPVSNKYNENSPGNTYAIDNFKSKAMAPVPIPTDESKSEEGKNNNSNHDQLQSQVGESNDNINIIYSNSDTNSSVIDKNEKISDDNYNDPMKYVTFKAFIIASLLGCSPCYRTWFSKRTIKKKVLIKKQISI